MSAIAQYNTVDWTNAFEINGTYKLIGNYCDGSTKTTLVYADVAGKASKLTIVFVNLLDNSTTVLEHAFEKPVQSIIGGYNKEDSFVILYETIDANETGFSQEIKSLEINSGKSNVEKSITQFTSTNKLFFGKAKFSQSLDFKKTLLFIESPFVSGEKESISIIIYNEKGIEESNFTSNLDIDAKQNVHNYPQISNSGTVFFLKKDKDKNAHRYFLYSFNPSTKDIKQKQIALANTNITEIKGQVTAQNEFLVGGFTASAPIHFYEGYYLFKFGEDCVQKFKTQAQFDESTFLRFMTKKEFSRDATIKDFYLDNILLLESGKIYLAAECYREETISKTETWASYKDIMLVCFDAAGKYKTTYNYKKSQSISMNNSFWASYKTFPNADTLVIAHNFISKPEGKKVPEPVFTFVNVHEKYGTKTKSAAKIGAQADTPFFIPELIYNPNTKQYLCLFGNFDRTKFRIGIFNL
jgi:hypothetical protein